MEKHEFQYGYWAENPNASCTEECELYDKEHSKIVRNYHQSMPNFNKSNLENLKNYAKETGIAGLFVKNECYRLGLNAFKILGGSYAIFRLACEKLSLDPEKTLFRDLLKPENKEKLEKMTFITATDGNHGKGVAYTAHLLGCKAYVYMPSCTVPQRAKAIKDAGAFYVEISNECYDDCVRTCSRLSKENGWYMVQDTTWDGCGNIPFWIMQGYMTMFYESIEQLKEQGVEEPSHIFLQCGVGSMAAAVLAAARATFGTKPVISIVEATGAACLVDSVVRGDDNNLWAEGDGKTIMAGLNCSEVSKIAYPLLRDCSDFFIACNDFAAARGLRIYSAPLENDPVIKSCESGASTMGLLSLILEKESCKELKTALKLDENSNVLLFNTEGITDSKNWHSIVWDGKYSE